MKNVDLRTQVKKQNFAGILLMTALFVVMVCILLLFIPFHRNISINYRALVENANGEKPEECILSVSGEYIFYVFHAFYQDRFAGTLSTDGDILNFANTRNLFFDGNRTAGTFYGLGDDGQIAYVGTIGQMESIANASIQPVDGEEFYLVTLRDE